MRAHTNLGWPTRRMLTMRIGVIRENDAENRVSIVPNSIKKLIKAGFEVNIETGAGDRSNHSDSEYETMGAKVVGTHSFVFRIGMI